jgi:hypothetical protein
VADAKAGAGDVGSDRAIDLWRSAPGAMPLRFWPMLRHRRLLAALTVTACLAQTGCTLAKPIVGIVTGPVIILGNSGGLGCGCDGRGVACALAVLAVVGAGAGLVTGIISDVRVLAGAANDPSAN